MQFFLQRTIVAGLLCLNLTFLFDLDQPKWVLITVILISLPLAGMTLKRSFVQVLGTAAGASMAMIFIALFLQATMPFIPSGWSSVRRAERCCATRIPMR